MAVAFVKSTTSAEGSSVSSIATSAFSGSTTSGNALIATGSYYDGDGDVAGTDTFSDSKTNSWAVARAQSFTNNDGRVAIGYALNITGGASHTVTFTPGDTGLFITCGAMEFSGVATSAATDGANSNSSASGTTASTNSITPAANGVAVAVVSYDGGATTIANFGGSWNLAYEIDENNDASDQHVEYQLTTASNSYSASSALGVSRVWLGAIAGFAEGAGGGGATPSYLTLLGVG